jgi:pimeloyl-ACP methyl ester carboxylesterase
VSVVLVHGAYHGAWAWERVIPELEHRGEQTVAVELPFTGFTDDVAATREAIERAGPGVVVCGHSYGGLVISAAAQGRSVGHLVYLSAFMVDQDENYLQLWSSRPVPLHEAAVRVEDRLTVDPAKARDVFYADSDEATATSMLSRLRSIPARDRATGGFEPAWRSLPSTYIVCTRDRAIDPEVQRSMARHAHTVIEWDSDHSPLLTRPSELAAILADLA